MFRGPKLMRYIVQLLGVVLIIYLLQWYNIGTDIERNGMLPNVLNERVQENNIFEHDNRRYPRRIRICCLILTSPINLDRLSKYIQLTWAKRCDRVVFVSSQTNTTFPTVGMNTTNTREQLTKKTLRAFRYVAQTHLEDCDWFFKANDRTYVIMENLRHFLEDKDPNEAVHYGYLTRYHNGCGMVVSKEAMRRFAEKGLDNRTCSQTGGGGDATFGRCLENLGVKMMNPFDTQGRSRFNCYTPHARRHGLYPEWFQDYDAREPNKYIEADLPISFYGVEGPKQLLLEYYLYSARVHSHDGLHHV